MYKVQRRALLVFDRSGVEEAPELAVPQKEADTRDAGFAKHHLLGVGVKLQVQGQYLGKSKQQRQGQRQQPFAAHKIAPLAPVNPYTRQTTGNGDQGKYALGHHRDGAKHCTQQQVFGLRLRVKAQPVVAGGGDAAGQKRLGLDGAGGVHQVVGGHHHQQGDQRHIPSVQEPRNPVGVVARQQVEQEPGQDVIEGTDAADFEEQRSDPERKVRLVQPAHVVQYQIAPVAGQSDVLRQRCVQYRVALIDDGGEQRGRVDQQADNNRPPDVAGELGLQKRHAGAPAKAGFTASGWCSRWSCALPSRGGPAALLPAGSAGRCECALCRWSRLRTNRRRFLACFRGWRCG